MSHFETGRPVRTGDLLGRHSVLLRLRGRQVQAR